MAMLFREELPRLEVALSLWVMPMPVTTLLILPLFWRNSGRVLIWSWEIAFREASNQVPCRLCIVMRATPCLVALAGCCGLRGFRKETITGLDLRTTGMEFASEMVMKASLRNLRICEVPTTLSPDGRSRKPHLRSWRDGWRHLRFLLVFSPNWLFLYPGAVLMLIGFVGLLLLFPRPLTLGGITFDIHTMLYCAVASTIGFQMMAFWIFSKAFAIDAKLLPPTPILNKLRGQPFLEFGIVIGLVLSLSGVMGSVAALRVWESHSFGPLIPGVVMRIVIPSITVLIIGIQCILASFFLAILGLARK